MRWIVLNEKHINVEMIRSFHWGDQAVGYGRLYINLGNERPLLLSDPHRELYRRLCEYTGQSEIKA